MQKCSNEPRPNPACLVNCSVFDRAPLSITRLKPSLYPFTTLLCTLKAIFCLVCQEKTAGLFPLRTGFLQGSAVLRSGLGFLDISDFCWWWTHRRNDPCSCFPGTRGESPASVCCMSARLSQSCYSGSESAQCGSLRHPNSSPISVERCQSGPWEVFLKPHRLPSVHRNGMKKLLIIFRICWVYHYWILRATVIQDLRDPCRQTPAV